MKFIHERPAVMPRRDLLEHNPDGFILFLPGKWVFFGNDVQMLPGLVLAATGFVPGPD